MVLCTLKFFNERTSHKLSKFSSMPFRHRSKSIHKFEAQRGIPPVLKELGHAVRSSGPLAQVLFYFILKKEATRHNKKDGESEANERGSAKEKDKRNRNEL